MQLMELLEDVQGHHKGSFFYFTEDEARRLVESKLARYAYKDRKMVTVMSTEGRDIEPEEENKAPDKPKKDKMIHSPVKKK